MVVETGSTVRRPVGWRALPRPRALGTRGVILLSIAIATSAAFALLDAPLARLVPQRGGAGLVREFFAGALFPALTYESAVPDGTPALWLQALDAARRTVVFAAAAMSLALLGGSALGFLGSTAWWSADPVARHGGGARLVPRMVSPLVYAATRAAISAMRSVHELLWAVLFLAAFGLNTTSAVIAIAIPYAGTLAKVFSEMIDEAPRDAGHALRAVGARPLAVFAFGLLPRAAPDMCAYAFYRFECAVRSSAILGFFGFPTLGYHVAQSFENLHYREVWSYLYTLIALVVAIELWSGAVRKRFVA